MVESVFCKHNVAVQISHGAWFKLHTSVNPDGWALTKVTLNMSSVSKPVASLAHGVAHQCIRLARWVGKAYGSLATVHAGVYSALVKTHLAARWAFVVALTGIALAFVLLLAV